MEKIIELRNGIKKFKISEDEIIALNNVNVSFESGKIYCIIGHSGSGKSTLIQILGLLDELTSGELLIYGKDTKSLSEKEKAKLRMKNIGFVFQSYFLNKDIRAIDNVMMPMYINSDIISKERRKISLKLLQELGLGNRVNHLPTKLSGGEQQRVAIARALANDPLIILADEPTGNLDKENELNIIKIFQNLKEKGKCIIITTHSEELTKYADTIFELQYGKLEEVVK